VSGRRTPKVMKSEGQHAAPSLRNILVAVAGGSPAIVTETLWSLTKQKNVRVDEVRVLTTEEGKAAILNTLLSPKDGRFQSCVEELELNHQITFNDSTVFVFEDGKNGKLTDIRTDEDNTLASDQICAFIRDWTAEPNTQLFCSVAGGRKTMSIYLTIAMMLYGRKDDRLFHVLVNPEDFEVCKDFFHPTRTPRELPLPDREGDQIKTISTANVSLDLAEVPFVKLRVLDTSEVFGENQSYSAIVNLVQERLDFLSRAASSHVKIGHAGFVRGRISVEVAGKVCLLNPAPAFVYALFAENRKKNGDGVEVDFVSPRDLKRIYRHLTGCDYEEDLCEPGFDFVTEWLRWLMSRDEHSLESFRGAIETNVSRARKALRKAGFPRQFMIQNLTANRRGKKSQGAMYTINLPGDAIHLPSL
jgi:CRISPR-associated protein (TIGR02584 family)